ncbi:MAG: AAA family ATPase [Cystobacter sp.]
MFLSLSQVKQSLERLKDVHNFFGMSFLAFKKIQLPVGFSRPTVFTTIINDILQAHYRPYLAYEGFYNPFRTSDQSKRWMIPRYGSTSLQRITTDTFADALIHEKNSPEWGWKLDYIDALQKHLEGSRIPAFDLAVWLYRDRDWQIGTSPQEVQQYLFHEYHINTAEQRALFDTTLPPILGGWLVDEPISEQEILSLIEFPPGFAPEGAALHSLTLSHIGPGSKIEYTPGKHLNIITGDNSLGKTFLLDCSWRALTGEWISDPPQPKAEETQPRSELRFRVTTAGGRPSKENISKFNWESLAWSQPERSPNPGFVLYARFDGSFALWDSARDKVLSQRRSPLGSRLLFSREAVWEGLKLDGKQVCNGLLRDWVSWQTSGNRFAPRWRALQTSIEALSPSKERIQAGEPIRLPFSDQEIPTVRMTYGEVPVVHASAGVQRALALAYMAVWAWFQHQEYSQITKKEVTRSIVLLIDEAEAHLHPRWQRVIVPAIRDVLSKLAPLALPQVHLATHSPMVLASAEMLFDPDQDALHHLVLTEENDVVIEQLDFVKRGRADLWLMSDVFGLEHARSLPAEEALLEAKKLQLLPADAVRPEAVQDVHARLVECLAEDDDFWPRWMYFAEKYGVEP